MRRLQVAFFCLFFLLIYNIALAQEKSNKNKEIVEQKDSTDREEKIEEIVVRPRQILGSQFQARNRTGSAYYISPVELKKFNYTDINRMLKSVPGVNMYEEDGFGLRPNISLRGTKAERSERITLMEDGILAAPAPYSAPAAYYFPNAARMHAVEVLKGSSQVQYGPFTTGGAINLVSTPIPSNRLLHFNLSYGSFSSLKLHSYYGNSHKYYSYLVEYLRFQTSGFKYLAMPQDLSMRRNDILAKFRINNDLYSDNKHSLEFKYAFANELSHETYVGLSRKDFLRSPFMRYPASQLDRLDTYHHQASATYVYKHLNNFTLVAQAYYNFFHRNWYKLNAIRSGNTKAEQRSLEAVLDEPDFSKTYMDILTGAVDYDGEGLLLRANNRDYHSRGLQAKAEYVQEINSGYITLESGIRWHEDMEDRYQWDDSYGIRDGKMFMTYAALHGSESNRLTSARAFSSYILAKLTWQNLTITTGVRHENIYLHLNDMGKNDLRRTGKERLEDENSVKAWIPSLGLNYKLFKGLNIFAGVHKGFAPPSVRQIPRRVEHQSLIPQGGFKQQDAESSINMELGTRLAYKSLYLELIAFHNAYSNMVGSDLAAAGGTGTLEQFNIGKANVQGLESLLHIQLLPSSWKRLQMPLQLSYTYTDTRMLNTFVSSSWGRVNAGDEIPYIYKHSLNASLGLDTKWFNLSLSCRYNGDMRARPGQNAINERDLIPSHVICDMSLKVPVYKKINLSLNVINLFNKTYLSSIHPAGLRPGHPRGIYLGVNADF